MKKDIEEVFIVDEEKNRIRVRIEEKTVWIKTDHEFPLMSHIDVDELAKHLKELIPNDLPFPGEKILSHSGKKDYGVTRDQTTKTFAETYATHPARCC